MKLVQGSFTCAAFVAAIFGASLCGGCSKPDADGAPRELGDQSGAPERVGVTTVTGADIGTHARERAVDRIVAGRCARELACDNIGSYKHFVNHDLCLAELRSQTDVRASDCTRGIDSGALESCLDAIRNESCNNSVETVARLAACRASVLCLSSSPVR